MRDPSEERTQKELPFEINVEYTLRKENVRVTTNDYEQCYDEEEGFVYEDTNNVDWSDVYTQSRYTIHELLEELKRLLENELVNTPPMSQRATQIRGMLQDARGWEIESKYELS